MSEPRVLIPIEVVYQMLGLRDVQIELVTRENAALKAELAKLKKESDGDTVS